MTSATHSPPLRLLYVSPSGALGGAERVLLDTLHAARVAFPTAKLTLFLMADGPLAALAREWNVDVITMPMPSQLAAAGDGDRRSLRWIRSAIHLLTTAPPLWNYVRRLRQVIAELCPDLIHSNGIKSHLLCALASSQRQPIIWHLHDYYGARRLSKYLMRFAVRRMSCGLAISHSVADDFRRSVSQRGLAYFPNAVDTERFTPASPNDELHWLDRSAGVPPSPPPVVRVGLVATYATWKGHRLFLESIAQLKRLQHQQKVRYFIVGGPIYQTQNSQITREELKQFAKELGIESDVFYLPFQLDMPRVYQALDIVVHASTQPEPFGLTIIEAMASGKAVISTATGGAAELFEHGIEAIALPRCDAAALAQALEEVIADHTLRKSLGEKARQAACSRFDRRQVPSRLQHVYSQLLKLPSPSIPESSPSAIASVTS